MRAGPLDRLDIFDFELFILDIIVFHDNIILHGEDISLFLENFLAMFQYSSDAV